MPTSPHTRCATASCSETRPQHAAFFRVRSAADNAAPPLSLDDVNSPSGPPCVYDSSGVNLHTLDGASDRYLDVVRYTDVAGFFHGRSAPARVRTCAT